MKSIINFFNRTTDPEPPSLDKHRFYFKNGVPTWQDGNGNVRTLETNIFGQGVELSTFEDYVMTTAGTNFDTYLGLQVPQGAAGTYIVFAFYHARMNSTGSDAWSRIAKNGTALGLVAREEYKDSSSNEAMPRTIIKKVDLAEGDYLDLDFATESSSATLTVKEGCLLLWRIA